jgi:imidazolonepropionase-like amidohydrolase
MLRSLAAICLVGLGLAPSTGHAHALRWRIAAPGATRDLDHGLQGQRGREDATTIVTVLRPARVFDGETTHEGWAVRVKDDRIDAVGPAASMITAGAGVKVVDLPGTTLMPGLVEGHSHVLLHPYNETSWNDQVAHESLALRTARAVNHLRATLLAGFTLVRDLGTEGAG